MIQPFVGEFLFHPAAIDISGNHCSHNCAYCFAHTRGDGKIMKLQSIINRLKRAVPKTYLDWLIKLGYPICLSNWSDPFSKNNYIQTNNLAYHLANIPNGIFIQTKGGHGIDEFIEIMGEKKNIVWYITITTGDNELAKRIEPDAPSPTERLSLIKKLTGLGYVVVAGINPLFEQWTDYNSFVNLVKDIENAGTKNIIIEPLHINKKEFIHFSERRKQALGLESVDNLETESVRNFMEKCCMYLIDNGFNTSLSTRMPYRTELFNEFRRGLGGKQFFVNYDFVQYCFSLDYEKGKLITLKDYLDFMQKGNEEIFDMPFKDLHNNYVLRYAFKLWTTDKEMQNIHTFRQLLTAFWNNLEFRVSMQHNRLFKLVNDSKDENGNVLLWFNGLINAPDDWEISINDIERV